MFYYYLFQVRAILILIIPRKMEIFGKDMYRQICKILKININNQKSSAIIFFGSKEAD